MYEPVLVDKELDLYNVYEVHKNYRILAMTVNVPLQVAEEICHILNNFGYQGFITSEYSLKNPYQKPFDFTQVKV